jgi:myo-inositol 2-dehydrogenase/D-chiro-inositol 1-dehydrogenase
MNSAFALAPEMVNYENYLRRDLRIAIVGLGKMGVLHGATLGLLMPGCVRAVVDKSRLLVLGGSKIAKTIHFYRDLEDMLSKEDPDVVYVTTPAQSHSTVVSSLLEAGVKYLFVEKPPTTCSSELAMLLDKTHPNQIVMVGFQKRYSLPFRHAKMLLSKSVIGEAKRICGHIRSSDILAPTTRFDRLGRGVLLDLGVHLADLLVWIFGACTVDESRLRSIHTSVDDCLEARMRTENGAEVVLDVTWSNPEYRIPETLVEVEGTEGVLRATEDYVTVESSRGHPLIGDQTQFSLHKPQYYKSLPPVNLADPEYTLENMHFLSSIHSSTEPLTGLKSAYKTMALVDELYRMARG